MLTSPPLFHSEGGYFKATLNFPKEYPNRPPAMKFTSEIWHPNGELRGLWVVRAHSKLDLFQKVLPAGYQIMRLPYEHMAQYVRFNMTVFQLRRMVQCVSVSYTSLVRTAMGMRGRVSAGCLFTQ